MDSRGHLASVVALFDRQLEGARRATATGDRVRVRETEAEIDHLAPQLWGLTEEELAEIQRNLEELG